LSSRARRALLHWVGVGTTAGRDFRTMGLFSSNLPARDFPCPTGLNLTVQRCRQEPRRARLRISRFPVRASPETSRARQSVSAADSRDHGGQGDWRSG
jgi:hypothetical protein